MSTRRKAGISALLAAALLLGLGGCTPKPAGPKRQETSFLVLFDTVTSIVGYTDDEEQFNADVKIIHDELETYHNLYDIYHSYSGLNNLKTVNDNAGTAPVPVDRKIIDLLLKGKEMEAFTGGKVNVAMGSVLSLWHRYREAGLAEPEQAELPPMSALEEAAKHCDINDVVIDEAASTVYLADPAMSLDVGAIAKGYATQRACDAARARGVDALMVNVGGNVCAIGGKSAELPWTVGVQDPADPQKYLQTLSIKDRTLVTSGSYQRFYTVDGQNYHHIIDPETLLPADYCAAVTVLSGDSGTADALSTALFNLPYEAGAALLARCPGTEAMWVMKDGTQQYSAGFQAYLTGKGRG